MTLNNRDPSQNIHTRGITKAETTGEPEVRSENFHKRRSSSVPTKASQLESLRTTEPHGQLQEYREELTRKRREPKRNGQNKSQYLSLNRERTIINIQQQPLSTEHPSKLTSELEVRTGGGQTIQRIPASNSQKGHDSNTIT